MTRPRPKTAPRKAPRQERARATVEAILQAAAYILVRRGWEGFTTNAVAERAGVNIASLYQYFPNKESIVVELERRHVTDARSRFPQAIPVLRSQRSLEAALRLMVQAGVEEHARAPALHRVFSEELPRSVRRRPRAEDAEVEHAWLEALSPFLKNVPDRDIAGFVLRTALHAIVHEAAARRPELLTRPELVAEVVLLLRRYLERPVPRRR